MSIDELKKKIENAGLIAHCSFARSSTTPPLPTWLTSIPVQRRRGRFVIESITSLMFTNIIRVQRAREAVEFGISDSRCLSFKEYHQGGCQESTGIR
jgi:hypothetical protein